MSLLSLLTIPRKTHEGIIFKMKKLYLVSRDKSLFVVAEQHNEYGFVGYKEAYSVFRFGALPDKKHKNMARKMAHGKRLAYIPAKL